MEGRKTKMESIVKIMVHDLLADTISLDQDSLKMW